MNFKKNIPLFALVIAAACLFFWPRKRNKDLPSMPDTTSASEATNQVFAASTNSQTGAAAENPASHKINDRNKPEEIERSIEAKNSPIVFYGKIVDQDNRPVLGAKVTIGIRQWYVRSIATIDVGARFITVETESGGDGRFVIHGAKGDGFGVGIVKDGYQLSPKAPTGFGPTAGSVDNPVIIKMWKKGASAQLVSQDKDTRIPYDGTPVVFDLLTGQKHTDVSAAGDLRITLTRNPLNIPSGYRSSFAWHATIEAIGGGLNWADDEFVFLAPESGYQQRIQINMPANATNWANVYSISFYAKTRNGSVYSRVNCQFRLDSTKPQTGFTFSSTANPNGSRNLQP